MNTDFNGRITCQEMWISSSDLQTPRQAYQERFHSNPAKLIAVNVDERISKVRKSVSATATTTPLTDNTPPTVQKKFILSEGRAGFSDRISFTTPSRPFAERRSISISMKAGWIFRRGDVYLADCGEWHGSIQGGIRPVVIMQNNIGNRYSPTVCVVKLTSKAKKKPGQPTHYTLIGIRGIPHQSQVLAEQVATINKTDIIRYMAHLSGRQMEAINQCVKIEMGLTEERTGGMEHDIGTDA